MLTQQLGFRYVCGVAWPAGALVELEGGIVRLAIQPADV